MQELIQVQGGQDQLLEAIIKYKDEWNGVHYNEENGGDTIFIESITFCPYVDGISSAIIGYRIAGGCRTTSHWIKWYNS